MATHNDTARYGGPAQQVVAACGSFLCLCAALALAGCGKDKRPSSSGGPGAGEPTSQPPTMIEVSSSAFAWGSPIPKKHAYTGEGQNVSPPLAWQWHGEPAGTKEFALIVDDPDAPVGTWVHWVLYKIPANTAALPEGAGRPGQDPALIQGKNSWNQAGYGGPMPPPGSPHRYYFRLYALDAELDLQPGLTADQLRQAVAGHVLATGELMGTYQR